MKLSETAAHRKAKARMIVTAIAAALVAALAGPVVAWGVTDLEYDPGTGGVNDNPTVVEVNKLEKGTTEYVVGARMQIVRKDTGDVVEEWTTAKEGHKLSGRLDVGVTYVLREVTAPEGYQKAPDTEFTIQSVEQNTQGQILNKHDDASFSNVAGTGDEQCFVLNLYDKATVTVQKEEHQQRTVSKSLPQTSDIINTSLIVGLSVAGVAALGIGTIVRKRHD